jgi:hypothetical protein
MILLLGIRNMTCLKFYPELQQWNSDVKESVNGPFFTMSVPDLYVWSGDYDGRVNTEIKTMTYIGLIIARWLVENGAGCRFWYIGKYAKTSVLILDNETVFKNLLHWFQIEKIEKRSIWAVFKDRDSFLKTITDSGEIVVQGKVEYYLYAWERDRYIDKKCFDIWCWLQRFATHRHWYWDRHFYFESHEDATLFKLTWYKENEKQVA